MIDTSLLGYTKGYNIKNNLKNGKDNIEEVFI